MFSIDYVKEHIDEIDDFYDDGMLINLDGIGFAKICIKAVE